MGEEMYYFSTWQKYACIVDSTRYSSGIL